ncbi:hypothetical protein TIFTF001_012447 [Ficus carica]|uniref:DDE Tnp4 domain-containing protein n=1 Tax=Ficus carica TaxID=3494 RepID=A0AA88ACB5_FICCA|nr:hypothetical protein TIFTF001_012447 [Ficus carica]
MPRKASGETYIWDTAKEKKNSLQKLMSTWPTVVVNIHPLQSSIDRPTSLILRYDQSTDRVICSDDAWQSFIQVYKKCNHLRHEGLRTNELHYNVFEKNHAAGGSGFGSVTMRDDSTPYVDHEGSMDNSGTWPVLEEHLTLTTSARHCNNRRLSIDAGPSRSRGSSGKRKQREETNEMTYMAMQEILSHFHSQSHSGTTDNNVTLLRCSSTAPAYHLLPDDNRRAVCSFDMKFTYMLAGYEGSCHDARMLEEAIAFHDFPIPPPGKVYVADSGYANKDCLMSLFRRETFKILKGINNYLMDKQVMISVACAILHNFIRMVQVGDPFLEENAADCVPVGGHVYVYADYVLADGVDGTGPSTGTQQHASRRGAMNQMRDMMVDDM